MSEHGESAPPSDSSRRSRAGSVVVLEDAEEDPPVVQSELLTLCSVLLPEKFGRYDKEYGASLLHR